MYYFPPNTDLNQQCTKVGLASALGGFTRTFSPEHPISLCVTKNLTYSLLNPEHNLWIVLTVKNAIDKKLNKEKKLPYPEYNERHFEDCLLGSFVRRAYNMFYLLNGKMRSLPDVDTLRSRCLSCFSNLINHFNTQTLSFVDTLDVVEFMPCESVYLDVHQCVRTVSSSSGPIYHSLVTYDGMVIDTTLPPQQTQKLHIFVTKFIFLPDGASKRHDGVSNNLSSPISSLSFWDEQQSEGFSIPSSTIPELKVYINENDETPYELVMFHHKKLCFAFVVKAGHTQQAHVLLSNHLPVVASTLSTQLTEVSNQNLNAHQEDSHKFIYFNSLNLSIRTSSRLKWAQLSESVRYILNRMHSDFMKMPDLVEVSVKTTADGWLAGRRNGQRYFYIIFDQKFSNSIEVHEEIEKMDKEYFNNIFMTV
eukprot:c18023_g1_i1.p1 GENE.c18023_g1_i1~~c18023_g1_i1.p1  ORF type:complete len:451 (+),score=143.61 c18023_g1_i1:92-1354(+)